MVELFIQIIGSLGQDSPLLLVVCKKQITTSQFGANLRLRRGGGKSPDLQSEYILEQKKITKNPPKALSKGILFFITISLKTTIHGLSIFRSMVVAYSASFPDAK